MMNSTRAKIGFSCTNYFRSIVMLVFALITALNKFSFYSFRNIMFNLVLVITYHFDFRLQFDINKICIFQGLTEMVNFCRVIKCCWEMYEFNKCTTRLKMRHLWIVDAIPFVLAKLSLPFPSCSGFSEK